MRLWFDCDFGSLAVLMIGIGGVAFLAHEHLSSRRRPSAAPSTARLTLGHHRLLSPAPATAGARDGCERRAGRGFL